MFRRILKLYITFHSIASGIWTTSCRICFLRAWIIWILYGWWFRSFCLTVLLKIPNVLLYQQASFDCNSYTLNALFLIYALFFILYCHWRSLLKILNSLFNRIGRRHQLIPMNVKMVVESITMSRLLITTWVFMKSFSSIRVMLSGHYYWMLMGIEHSWQHPHHLLSAQHNFHICSTWTDIILLVIFLN